MLTNVYGLCAGVVLILLGACLLPVQYAHATTTVSSNITSNTTWNDDVIVNAAILVNSGVTLTILSGKIVKFNGNSTEITVNGNLDARGTTSPIYFTSYSDDSIGGDTNGDGPSSGATGQWRQIVVSSTGSTTISNATVRFGGASVCCLQSNANLYNNGGILNLSDLTIASSSLYGLRTASGTTTVNNVTIRYQSTGSYQTGGYVSITNSTISNHSSVGVTGSGGTLTITGNTFTSNTGGAGDINNAMIFVPTNNSATGTGKKYIIHDNISANRTWHADNIPYVMDVPIDVNSGKMLIIEAGTIIKPASASFNPLNVYGTLDVQGTSGSQVYFTSFNDDTIGGDTGDDASTPAAGNWRGIKIESRASTTLAHAIIRYGGAGGFGSSQANIANSGGTLNVRDAQVATSSTYGIRNDSGTANITDSTIKYNSYGIYASGGTVTISGNVVNNNTRGLYVSGGTLTIANNAFHSNSTYAMERTGSATTTAENNYWGGWADLGGNSGPYHATYNANGVGDPVSNFVDFDPYTVAYLYDPADASTSPPAVNLDENEIRWGGSTAYSTEWDNAVEMWNASTSGAVNIYYAVSANDLLVEDIDDPLEPWAGKWSAEENPPKILLNDDQLSGASSNQVQCVASHELGHALGLAHSITTNIMYESCASGQVVPGAQDLADYEFVWEDGYLWRN